MRFYCVTPCLNSEKYIEQTMTSVLDQTIFQDKNFSLFYTIRDGGSTDGTVDIIKRVITKHSIGENIEVIYYSEKDSGMYDALSKGFEYGMKSNIFSYINAGDYYSPHAFEIVSDIFMKNQVHFLTGLNISYNEKGHLINCSLPFEYDKNLLLKGFYGSFFPFVQQESTFWDATVHQKIEWNQLRTFKFAGDFYLWRTFINFTPLYIVSAWLGGFTSHDGQLTSKFMNEYKAEMKSLTLSPNAFDYLSAFIHKILWYIPNRIKKKLSPHTFEYDNVYHEYRLSNGGTRKKI